MFLELVEEVRDLALAGVFPFLLVLDIVFIKILIESYLSLFLLTVLMVVSEERSRGRWRMQLAMQGFALHTLVRWLTILKLLVIAA